MDKEIRKTNWARFCKKFNGDNQYRYTRLSLKRRGENTNTMEMTPFMGIALSKSGRQISSIRFFAGRWDPDKIMEPIITLDNPSEVWLTQDENGSDCGLRIRTQDGAEAKLELFGQRETALARNLVEKVAYAMYENRGYTPGNDWNDWFEAENRVKEAEAQLTQ
jgi:hypothetical protein